MNRQQRRASLAHARATRNEWLPFEEVQPTGEALERWKTYRARIGNLIGAFRNTIYAVQIFLRAEIEQAAAFLVAACRALNDTLAFERLRRRVRR